MSRKKTLSRIERTKRQWTASAIAVNPAGPEDGTATPAMPDATAAPARAKRPGKRHTLNGSGARRGKRGGEPSAAAPISSSTPISTPSEMPSRPSNRPWQKPRTVREFAAQANLVATMILNGEIDMETARGYASLARVVAQSASVEVTRARFLRKEPDLSLE